mgnify:CR=1 FL=1
MKTDIASAPSMHNKHISTTNVRLSEANHTQSIIEKNTKRKLDHAIENKRSKPKDEMSSKKVKDTPHENEKHKSNEKQTKVSSDKQEKGKVSSEKRKSNEKHIKVSSDKKEKVKVSSEKEKSTEVSESSGDEMEDFIVQDMENEDGEFNVEEEEDDDDDEDEDEDEEVEEKDEDEENENNIEQHIDKNNIIEGKRTRKATRRYEEEVFASESYRNMMLCDIPNEEMRAALEDEDFSDDASSYESSSNEYSDDDDDDNEESS